MADVGVDIHIDLTGFNKKLSPYRFRRGSDAMLNQMLMDMDQFVPKKKGTLRFVGHVNTGRSQLVWQIPYARRQFYGPSLWKGKSKMTPKQRRWWFGVGIKQPKKGSRYTTPGTGPRWDLKAKARYGKQWAEVFVKGAGLDK